MRALRTAQPRRACDTTVFSCANRGDGVPGQWPPIIAWPVRRVRRGLAVPLRTADVVPTERSSLRRVSARSWASSIAHLGAKVSGPHSAHGSAPSRHFPAPLRRCRSRHPSPVPGPTSVHETGATTRVPWTLAGRVPSGARWSSSLCASAQWRVCTSQWPTSTHLARLRL